MALRARLHRRRRHRCTKPVRNLYITVVRSPGRSLTRHDSLARSAQDEGEGAADASVADSQASVGPIAEEAWMLLEAQELNA